MSQYNLVSPEFLHFIERFSIHPLAKGKHQTYPSPIFLWQKDTLFRGSHMMFILINIYSYVPSTVLPTKSDSDAMFVYKVISDLESKDHVCINPIQRIGLIHT